MPVLASTKVAERVPFGQYFLELHRVEIASNTATNEWVAVDFDEVRGVLLTMTGTLLAAAKPGAAGTAAGEGTTKRVIGVSAVGAGTKVMFLAVIGR